MLLTIKPTCANQSSKRDIEVKRRIDRRNMSMGMLYSLITFMFLVSGLWSMSIGTSLGNDKQWCVAKGGASNNELTAAIDYVCATMHLDCKPIYEGGQCYYPSTLSSHASFVMNRYYQSQGHDTKNCFFNGIGLITITDPSQGNCIYDQASSCCN